MSTDVCCFFKCKANLTKTDTLIVFLFFSHFLNFPAKAKREEYVAAITRETDALETVKELLRTASEMFVVIIIIAN